jgi:hypothetical protein
MNTNKVKLNLVGVYRFSYPAYIQGNVYPNQCRLTAYAPPSVESLGAHP